MEHQPKDMDDIPNKRVEENTARKFTITLLQLELARLKL
jgi:hypothetical protein